MKSLKGEADYLVKKYDTCDILNEKEERERERERGVKREREREKEEERQTDGDRQFRESQRTSETEGKRKITMRMDGKG